MTQAHLHNVMNIDKTMRTHATSVVLSYKCGTIGGILLESSWTHENSKGHLHNVMNINVSTHVVSLVLSYVYD